MRTGHGGQVARQAVPALVCQPRKGGGFYLQRRQAMGGRAVHLHAGQQGSKALHQVLIERTTTAHRQLLAGGRAMALHVLRNGLGGELGKGGLHIAEVVPPKELGDGNWWQLNCFALSKVGEITKRYVSVTHAEVEAGLKVEVVK